LFGFRNAFEHPAVVWICISLGVLLVIAPLIVVLLHRAGRINDATHRELIHRCLSWAVIAPIMIGPVLLGAAWTIGGVCLLSLFCYREFARATSVYRDRAVNLTVILGILAISFSVLENWYRFFVALVPVVIGLIALAGILGDRADGYGQRVALGVFAFILFGAGLGHLGFIANSPMFRETILFVLVTTELNDVFGYLAGKTFGKHKLAPNISPGKTVEGSIGAILLTTGLAVLVGRSAFAGTVLAQPAHLITLGVIISLFGQLGDLALSWVKRGLEIKDFGRLIPGHGGLLDRFDSLLVVPAPVFYYVCHVSYPFLDPATRVITG
jgi:phosphatidate cytidylyltransferase